MKTRLMLLVSTLALVLGLSVAPASAQLNSYTGYPGTVQIAAVAGCKLDTHGYLTVTGSSPRVWARNSTPGLHNDVANVRFMAVLELNGQLGQISGWSAWRQAWDNKSVTWPTGATMSWGQKNNSLRLAYLVEFHSVQGGLLGTSLALFDGYNFTSVYNVGPIGRFSSCMNV